MPKKPKKPAESNKRHPVSAKISFDLHERIKRIQDKLGVAINMTMLINNAVEKEVERLERDLKIKS